MAARWIFLFFTFMYCIASSSFAQLSDGLVGHWPLDGDGQDVIGGNDAETMKGAKFSNDGWLGGSVELDGAGGHMDVSDDFELTTDTLTVVAWINGWKSENWAGIVVGRADPATFWMGFGPADTLTYVWNNNNAATWDWKGASPIPQEEWAMTAIAIEPDKATSYTYSSETDKLNAEANEIAHIEQTVVNLKFGWDECCGNRYFRGRIDEVMIFDRTLDADEITQLATVGLAVESTGKLATTWAKMKQK